jgi:hypothetical protein
VIWKRSCDQLGVARGRCQNPGETGKKGKSTTGLKKDFKAKYILVCRNGVRNKGADGSSFLMSHIRINH